MKPRSPAGAPAARPLAHPPPELRHEAALARWHTWRRLPAMKPRSPSWRTCVQRSAALTAVLVATSALAAGDGEVGLFVLYEPAAGQPVAVVTPSLTAAVDARDWLRLGLDWSADIVSGATARTYGSVDTVSSATPFSEVRNTLGPRAELHRGRFTVAVGYHFGIESDYRSHQLSLSAKVDLNQRNTTLAVRYGHSFDSVCDLDQHGVGALARQPLSTSLGCFAATGLIAHTLDLDETSLSLTQVLSPTVVVAIVGDWERVDGFQSNPYRRVRLDTTTAQESHPLLRDRGAVTLRLRGVAPGARLFVGAEVRLYRDSWAVQSLTAQLSVGRRFVDERLLLEARVRFYEQSGAFFFRDAGRTDSYERRGPVGSWFTGDRELSPFGSLGAGATVGWRAVVRPRRALQSLDLPLAADVISLWSHALLPPSLPRSGGLIDGYALGLSAFAAF